MTRSPKARKLLGEALSLYETERLDLAAALLESVDAVRERKDAEMAWSFEARRRLHEVRLGVVKPVPWEEAERRILDPE